MIRLIKMDWQYTYRSARRDGYSRRTALRKFVRDVFMGLTTFLRYRNENGRLVRRRTR